MKELKQQKRWVNYTLEWNEKRGKNDKIPMCPLADRKADATNPNDWGTYEQAQKAVDAGIADGVGIVFTPDQFTVGLDIDEIDLENLKPRIIEIIEKANTYTEVSPSGNGLHLYFKTDQPLGLIANKKNGFEIYDKGRFFTWTENPYKEAKPIRTVPKDELLELFSLTGYPWGKDKRTTKAIANPGKSTFTDHDIIDAMFNSKIGHEIKDLYNGVSDKYKGDKSTEDFALLHHLAFWSGKDTEQMERIWLASPLGQRPKTQEREDYRKNTIEEVIAGATETYTPKRSTNIEDYKKLLNIR